MKKKLILGGLAVVLLAAGVAVWRIGPRNIIGHLRYDQRREGSLKVSDKAPDVFLVALESGGIVNLKRYIGDKPLVLIFGSYT